MEGYFSVQLASDSPFGRILVDHTIEVTVKKDKKTTAIMTRFSWRPALKIDFDLPQSTGVLDQLRSLV